MKILSKLLVITLSLVLQGNLFSQVIFPEIENWKKSEEPKIYNSETLWECINGAADYYLNYGFEKLEVVEYSLSEDEYIKAEVYAHGNTLNAFGIYAYERPTKTNFFSIGTQGYMQHSALNFYGGIYYIKVHSNQTDEKTIKAIKEIAEKLAEANIQENEKPMIFGLFPDKNKIENSEKYYPSNYLGYDFFNKALEVTYKNGDDKFKLFVINSKDKQQIEKMLTEYFEYVKFEAKLKENEVYEINDMFNDLVVLTYINNTLYGVFDTDNKKTANEYLKKLIASE